MVRDAKDRWAFKVVSPHTSGVDDGEHFSVVDGVVLLSWRELPGFVGDGLESLALILHKNGSNSVGGGIHIEVKWEVRVR